MFPLNLVIFSGFLGSVINYSNIAGILEGSQPNAKDYFRIAHGTFLWRTLPTYSKNVCKRVSRHPFYHADFDFRVHWNPMRARGNHRSRHLLPTVAS